MLLTPLEDRETLSLEVLDPGGVGEAEQVHGPEDGLGVAVRVRGVDVAPDHVVVHQAVDDVGALALGGADDGRVEQALTQQSCYQPQSSGSTFRRPVERRTETALKDLPESETGIKPRRFRSARPESEIADYDPKASRAEPDRAQVQAGQGILATLRFVT